MTNVSETEMAAMMHPNEQRELFFGSGDNGLVMSFFDAVCFFIMLQGMSLICQGLTGFIGRRIPRLLLNKAPSRNPNWSVSLNPLIFNRIVEYGTISFQSTLSYPILYAIKFNLVRNRSLQAYGIHTILAIKNNHD